MAMKIVLNSKFFADDSVEQLGEKSIELGYDGIDICVRPGHPIRADNVMEALPKAVKVWEGQGLVCPLATAAVDMINPKAPDAEKLYIACAEAGVPRLKIGFWKFNEGDDYWQVLDAARTALEGFVGFSEKHGVQTCYQIHSGSCVGSNCAGLMHLIKGFEPRHVGAYPDFGHMALDGEDWAMGLSMIQEYLSVVGIKDALYIPQTAGRTPPYIPCFVKVGEGCVNWHRCLGALRHLDFDGPLTVHTEYRFDESIICQVGYADASPPNLEQWAKEDVAYLRRMLSELENG
ncbi:MAG: sugar phosphate isomerase/epimerase [Candidatus Poribacteria bacterium]|nr:sugar phosphate isomerase/epimerase [Candidatus Poribacteria bacterium]